jgi:aryl-alcohol dehydrogenase-like predicted oxidoreductase
VSQPWGGVVLRGAANADQLRATAAAPDVRLDDTAVARLARLREAPEEYWRRRSELPWR